MEKIKLHLGCGGRYLPGWIHIDIDDYPHIDHRRSMDNLDLYADGSVDEIYACGALHYFNRAEATAALAEWFRVLKPGGTLRVAGIGDFEQIAKLYLKNKNINERGILGPLFGQWELKNGDTIYQKTAYDFNSLKQLLEDSGFRDVKRYNWQDFLPPDYDDYSKAYIPHMDTERGTLMVLNVEAKK